MILIFGILCLALAAATLCPTTPLGEILRHALIDAPAKGLSLEGLRKLGVGGLVLVGLLCLAAAPELLAVVAITDLALYAEGVALMTILGARDRIKDAATAMMRILKVILQPAKNARRRDAPRAPAAPSRPKDRRKPPAEPDPGWAFA